MLLSFQPVAEQVSKVIATPVEKIVYIAKTILFISLAVFLIYTGVAALAVPAIGVTLIVVGLSLLALTVWPLFKPKSTAPPTF